VYLKTVKNLVHSCNIIIGMCAALNDFLSKA